MKNIPHTLLMVLAFSGIAATAVADAQTSSSDPAATQNFSAMRGHAPEDVEKMKEHLARHQAEMHDKLRITIAQEPAWKAFTQAMTPAPMPENSPSKDQEKLTTPDRMAMSIEKMKQHEAFMQTRLSAVKALYAVLTPEQQKMFDEGHNRMRKEMQERMAKQMEKDGK